MSLNEIIKYEVITHNIITSLNEIKESIINNELKEPKYVKKNIQIIDMINSKLAILRDTLNKGYKHVNVDKMNDLIHLLQLFSELSYSILSVDNKNTIHDLIFDNCESSDNKIDDRYQKYYNKLLDISDKYDEIYGYFDDNFIE